MHDQQTYELIEAWLSGGLSGPELAAFEARLAAEPELRELADLHRDLHAAGGDAEALAFAEAVAAADAAYHAADDAASPAPAPVVRPLWRRPSVLAAAASIALVACLSLYLALQTPQSAQLFEQYYAPYAAPAQFRSGEAVLDSQYTAAFAAYNAGDFAQAEERFGALAGDAEQVTARFYGALSALAQGEAGLARAEAALAALSRETGHPYVSQSRWYLALVYLRQDQPDRAKTELEALSRGSGKYARMAKELLEAL